MNDPVIEEPEPGIRFISGPPKLVEYELNHLDDTYACQNLFFYVIDNHLEVCATLIHTREIRKAQFMQGQIAPGLKMRPN